jgi:hypothetical protein
LSSSSDEILGWYPDANYRKREDLRWDVGVSGTVRGLLSIAGITGQLLQGAAGICTGAQRLKTQRISSIVW